MLYAAFLCLFAAGLYLWVTGSFAGIFTGFPALCAICFATAYIQMGGAPTQTSSFWAFVSSIALSSLPFLIKQQAIAKKERRRDGARYALETRRRISAENAANRASQADARKAPQPAHDCAWD